MNTLLAAYRHTYNNWVSIGASKQCGCCKCIQTFAPEEIVAWVGLDMDKIDDPQAIAQQTAVCPKCGSEAVIGDASGYPVTLAFLGTMNEAWFHGTIVRKQPPAEP
jgi:hypothetical protein